MPGPSSDELVIRDGYFFGRSCACAPPTPWWRPETKCASDDDTLRRGPRLLNTFTKTKVPFVPLSGNSVGWYICGPTVYDSAHVGHARNYVNFDVLRRVMSEYFGYDVRFVMNVTDIDDKIIMRAHTRRAQDVVESARRLGAKASAETIAAAAETETLLAEGGKPLGKLDERTRGLVERVRMDAKGALASDDACARDWKIQDGYLELAREFEAEFMEDMKSLGIARPDALTRVSEYVDKVILYIQVIINKGFAYESNNSVYFDVKAFEEAENHKYGKLNKNAMANVEEAMDGEGALAAEKSEKRSEFDFVLWKASKAGEPSWSSPWGMGRPGWHIECSAMCSDILGKSVDINGGGIDLNFPHHENQLAQSEAHYDIEQWVNFFIHTGHLHIDGLKMSKSLKNFITIRAALKMYSARQIRFLFLLNQWCYPMELTPVAAADGSGVTGFKQMEMALNIEKQFTEFFHSVKGSLRESGSYVVRKDQMWDGHERNLSDALDTAQAAVHEALMDNINTPNTLLALQDLVKATNQYLSMTLTDTRPLLVERVAKYVTKILNCLGVCLDVESIGFPESTEGSSEGREQVLSPFLDLITKFRDDIRKLAQDGASKQDILAACDAVRDVSLPELGVKVDDREGGALWKLYDAEELKKEIAREREAKEEKERAKAAAKEEAARKAAEKEAKAKVPPSEMFKTFEEYAGLYSKFGDYGVPTHDAAGEPLQKSALKKLAKARGMQEKAHDQYLAKQGIEKLSV